MEILGKEKSMHQLDLFKNTASPRGDIQRAWLKAAVGRFPALHGLSSKQAARWLRLMAPQYPDGGLSRLADLIAGTASVVQPAA
jgi:hypothetical protein